MGVITIGEMSRSGYSGIAVVCLCGHRSQIPFVTLLRRHRVSVTDPLHAVAPRLRCQACRCRFTKGGTVTGWPPSSGLLGAIEER